MSSASAISSPIPPSTACAMPPESSSNTCITYSNCNSDISDFLNVTETPDDRLNRLYVEKVKLPKSNVTVEIMTSDARVPPPSFLRAEQLNVLVRDRRSNALSKEAMLLVEKTDSWREIMETLDDRCQLLQCPGHNGPTLKDVRDFYLRHDRQQLDKLDYVTVGAETQIFSKNCEMLAKARGGKCNNCLRITKKLAAMKKRHKEQDTTPKKQTNTKFLTKSQLAKRNKMRLDEIREKQLQEVKRLESEVAGKRGATTTPDEAIDIIIEQLAASDSALDVSFLRLYLTNALANSKKKKKTAYRYSNDLWEYVITLYSEGTSRYEKMRNTFLPLLPTPQAVRRRIGPAIEPRDKLDLRQITRLVKQVMHLGNKRTRSLVCVAIDEMSIERGIVRMNGRTIGYLPGTQSEFSGDELTSAGSLRLATHVTAIFVSSLDSKLRYPLYLCPTNGAISGNEMLRLFIETVSALTNVGLRVVSATSDSGDGERKLQHMLGVSHERPFYENPITGDRIFFLADPPHVLKRFRNTIYNNTRTIVMPCGGTVRWGLLRQLYEDGLMDGLKKIRKLTKSAVIHDRFSKMRVKWAALVCDPEVTGALKSLNSRDAAATALYFEMCYGWWRYINSKTVINRDNEDSILRRLDECIEWYTEWMSNGSISHEAKITTELFGDLKMTINSFKEVIQIAADMSDDFQVYPRRLNQDCVESFFSQLRSGSNASPTLHEATNRLNSIRLAGAVRAAQKRNQNTTAESSVLCSVLEIDSKSPARNSIFTPAKVLEATDGDNRRKSFGVKRRKLFHKRAKKEDDDQDQGTHEHLPKFQCGIEFPMQDIKLDHEHGIGVVTVVINELKEKTFALTKTETLLSKFTRELVLGRLDEVDVELLGTRLVDVINYTRDSLIKFGLKMENFEFDPKFGVPKDITSLSASQIKALAPHFQIAVVSATGYAKTKLELCEEILDVLDSDASNCPRPNILPNSKTIEDQLIGILYDARFTNTIITLMDEKNAGSTSRCHLQVMHSVVVQCIGTMIRTLALYVGRVLQNSIEDRFDPESSDSLPSEDMRRVMAVDSLDHMYRYSGFLINAVKCSLEKNTPFSTKREKDLLREALPIHEITMEPNRPRQLIFHPRKYDFPPGMDFKTNCPNEITLGVELDAISRGGLIWVSEDFFPFALIVEYVTVIALRFLFTVSSADEDFLVYLAMKKSRRFFEPLYQVDDDGFKQKIHHFFCRLLVVTLTREHHTQSTEQIKGIVRDDRTRAHKKKAEHKDTKDEGGAILAQAKKVFGNGDAYEREAALFVLDSMLVQAVANYENDVKTTLASLSLSQLQRLFVGYEKSPSALDEVFAMRRKCDISDALIKVIKATMSNRSGQVVVDARRVTRTVRLRDLLTSAKGLAMTYDEFVTTLPDDTYSITFDGLDNVALTALSQGLAMNSGSVKKRNKDIIKALHSRAKWRANVPWQSVLDIVDETANRDIEKQRENAEKKINNKARNCALRKRARMG